MSYEEGHNRNRCTCDNCKLFRKRRASKAVKEMWSRPWNDPSAFGQRGQDALLAKFAKKVSDEAKERGVMLTQVQLRKKAALRRDAYLQRLSEKRHAA